MMATRYSPGFLTFMLAGGALIASASTAGADSEAEVDLPPDFQQIIPRGRIASVDEPMFVSAREAEIPDDAWVLGVAIGGVAKAYSLNLLNHHEIVNDTSGDVAFAAVW